MAHKVLVGGTAYDITKGRTLIGGTGYDITKGRTLVGGTGYDISFVTATFDEIMADATVLSRAGRNSSSTANVSSSVTLQTSNQTIYDEITFYAFQFHHGYLGIVKVHAVNNGLGVDPDVEVTQIATTLTGSAAWYDIPMVIPYSSQTSSSVTLRVSADGGSTAAYVNAAMLMVVQFPNYPQSLVDKVLSSVTLTKRAGRDASSTGSVTTGNTITSSSRLFASLYALGVYLAAYSSPIGTVVFSTDTSNANASGLWIHLPYASLSTDGSSARALYGGSIVEVTE